PVAIGPGLWTTHARTALRYGPRPGQGAGFAADRVKRVTADTVAGPFSMPFWFQVKPKFARSPSVSARRVIASRVASVTVAVKSSGRVTPATVRSPETVTMPPARVARRSSATIRG